MGRLTKEREAEIRSLLAVGDGTQKTVTWCGRDLLDELDAVRAERDALLMAAKYAVGHQNPIKNDVCDKLVAAIEAAKELP